MRRSSPRSAKPRSKVKLTTPASINSIELYTPSKPWNKLHSKVRDENPVTKEIDLTTTMSSVRTSTEKTIHVPRYQRTTTNVPYTTTTSTTTATATKNTPWWQMHIPTSKPHNPEASGNPQTPTPWWKMLIPTSKQSKPVATKIPSMPTPCGEMHIATSKHHRQTTAKVPAVTLKTHAPYISWYRQTAAPVTESQREASSPGSSARSTTDRAMTDENSKDSWIPWHLIPGYGYDKDSNTWGNDIKADQTLKIDDNNGWFSWDKTVSTLRPELETTTRADDQQAIETWLSAVLHVLGFGSKDDKSQTKDVNEEVLKKYLEEQDRKNGKVDSIQYDKSTVSPRRQLGKYSIKKIVLLKNCPIACPNNTACVRVNKVARCV